ncbi:MAG: NAD-dependent epimerase/dehydratase family protein [Deltaproteobacteria bacterium]|jgi:nucleoside-diphosphate-sugar epimerase|nr:NAD-dependent epimerase/dehydratase family protein [Deltaproteobacteria bacterium]MBW2497875.1 NAD-dependent epimerase/dehydratase family protein [Deltaproteobacteria bacterium]
MRILVTGATGFIGSHTVRSLLDAGHRVKLLVRSEEKARRIWGDRPGALEDLVVGKITSGPATAEALRDCDGLVHTAAPVALGFGRSAARQAVRENLRAIRLLVEAALERGMERIVHLSSTTVFDCRGLEIADEKAPIVEGGDAYARSKAAPERRVRELQAQGAPISIVYPSAVVGPDDPGLSEGMAGLAGQLQAGVLVTSSGFQLVDVRDLAEVHLGLIERSPAAGRYIAVSRYMPWEEFATLLDQSAGIRLPRMRLPGRGVRAIGAAGDLLRRFVEVDPAISREATRFATQWVEFDATGTREALGVEFRDPRETLDDAVRWLAEAGHIPAERALRWTHPGRGRGR